VRGCRGFVALSVLRCLVVDLPKVNKEKKMIGFGVFVSTSGLAGNIAARGVIR
jgi:hypothetical protein